MSRWGEQAASERGRSRGWGYSIDYAATIREDEARVAHLSSEACVRVSRELLPEASAAWPAFSSWDAYLLVTYKPEGMEARAAVFGLTIADVRAWAYFTDETREDVWRDLGDAQKGDYAIGKAISGRLDHYTFEVYSEEGRRKALTKAKAALSRHKRNAEKHG